MSKFVYTVCNKTNGRILDITFTRSDARAVKNELEFEYPTSKFIINQMAINKRVR